MVMRICLVKKKNKKENGNVLRIFGPFQTIKKLGCDTLILMNTVLTIFKTFFLSKIVCDFFVSNI